MENILERMQREFQERLNGDLKKAVIEDFWRNGESLEIWYVPESMTGEQFSKVNAAITKGDIAGTAALTLIYMARNADGDRLFRRANLTELTKMISGLDLLKLSQAIEVTGAGVELEDVDDENALTLVSSLTDEALEKN